MLNSEKRKIKEIKHEGLQAVERIIGYMRDHSPSGRPILKDNMYMDKDFVCICIVIYFFMGFGMLMGYSVMYPHAELKECFAAGILWPLLCGKYLCIGFYRVWNK